MTHALRPLLNHLQATNDVQAAAASTSCDADTASSEGGSYAQDRPARLRCMRNVVLTCVGEAGIALLDALVQEMDAVLHLEGPLQDWPSGLIQN